MQPKREKSMQIDEIARLPLPGMAVPGSLSFSPDNRWITYLYSPEQTLTRQLYAYDTHTGNHQLLVEPAAGGVTDNNISLEEALRRERQRQREWGITQYAWAEHANRLVIPLRGEIYVQDGVGAPLRKVVSGDEPVLDAQISPDGQWVSFVQDAELYIVPAAGGEPVQLTHGARGTGKTNGLAEFIAQEEMGRSHGYWWSSDSQMIAFEEVDETHIPIYRIVHQGKSFTGEGAQEDHRYPFAGQANARVRLGVITVEGGEPVWMDLGDEEDIYLARVDWLPDGELLAQIENREQSRLDLVRFNPHTGVGALLLIETSEVWINLHNLLRPLRKPFQGESGTFVWASERSGFRHLYLYNSQGDLIRPLTRGDWLVDDVVAIDEDQGWLYFTGTLDGPTETHLYSVSLEGGEPRRLTNAAGIHSIVIDKACKQFIDGHNNLETPPRIVLCDLETGAELAVLYDQPDPRVTELDLEPPELVQLSNRHGDTLYGAIYRPPSNLGNPPYPAIVNVYGGPHVQLAVNSWMMTVNLRAQYLRSLGFLVFVLDNRGSTRRGLKFEAAIRHNMGKYEVEDQVDGIAWLVAQGLADPERVGIYGWSYGGYMTAMCLVRAPESFRVGVAGAPVTAYDGYDTHYTERYMGTPQNNPEGYRDSSVMPHVENLSGKLMLVHGMIDENVHFRHTARLIDALVEAGKTYDLLLFPNERHMPRKPADRIYMEKIIAEYFLKNLA